MTITEEQKKVLRNSRDSLLYHNDRSWQKKTGLFDVTMGSYDGCELCELIGLFIIDRVNKKHPEINFGLYRDDGLGTIKIIPKPQLIRLEKRLHKTFKEIGLTITCDTKCNNVVNFLDVTLNLQKNTFSLFRKPNDHPVYIHKESNHPPHTVNSRYNANFCAR